MAVDILSPKELRAAIGCALAQLENYSADLEFQFNEASSDDERTTLEEHIENNESAADNLGRIYEKLTQQLED